MELFEKVFAVVNGILVFALAVNCIVSILQTRRLTAEKRKTAQLEANVSGLERRLLEESSYNSILIAWNKDYIQQRDDATRQMLETLSSFREVRGFQQTFATSVQANAIVGFLLANSSGGCRLGCKPDEPELCGLTIQTHFGRLLFYYPSSWDETFGALAPKVEWDWSGTAHAQLIASQPAVVDLVLLRAQQNGDTNANG